MRLLISTRLYSVALVYIHPVHITHTWLNMSSHFESRSDTLDHLLCQDTRSRSAGYERERLKALKQPGRRACT